MEGIKSVLLSDLQQLLLEELFELRESEIILAGKLDSWLDSAHAPRLREVLGKYLDFVKRHRQMLDQELLSAEEWPLPGQGRVMHALAEATALRLENCSDAPVTDACLLAAIQEMNHYKISKYGTAAALAAQLEKEESRQLLAEACVHEKHIDDRLSQLAFFEINRLALHPLV